MKLHVAAWHYRARAIIQRVWGWSPIEEMVLLRLHTAPGTVESVASALSIPSLIIDAAVARLMQFGLVEVQLVPKPVLVTSMIGKELVHTDRPLPERTVEREVSISLVYERAGHSVFRRRDVTLDSTRDSTGSVRMVGFPKGEPPETDDTMADRVQRLVASQMRPGEWMRGIRAVNSVIEQKFVVFDMNDARDGVFPEGASEDLKTMLGEILKTGNIPKLKALRRPETESFRTTFTSDGLVVGAEEHLSRFEEIADSARSDLFVLSTFVAPAEDEKGREHRERIIKAIERACRRGVHVHLFYGTTLDERSKNANAMEALRLRLTAGNLTRGYVLVHRDPVASHAKFLAADDGQGGAVVLLGSCNWLSSPFNSVEISAEVREHEASANLLDVLRNIVGPLAVAKRSVEELTFMAAELRRRKRSLTNIEAGGAAAGPSANMTILFADDHERVLRSAAHRARNRFVCCTNRLGAPMVPGVFNPAHVAGQRVADVRVYYSRRSGPIKRPHVARQRERLVGLARIIPVREPQLHAKFLAWDTDSIVITSMNWASQTGLAENALDEIGILVEAPELATALLKRFETFLPADARGSVNPI
ncbi:phospholipase D-like domain-containing protein [Agrobacterium tumefaciens]|uniref:phospholipase D-like domain-containing protein n=1 Tax=Agrobacterium tumefaciens TaxID=358 RepID=UPI000DD31948